MNDEIKDAVNNCLIKRDAEWAKALGWPDIAERNGPMYPDDVKAFLARRATAENAVPAAEKLEGLVKSMRARVITRERTRGDYNQGWYDATNSAADELSALLREGTKAAAPEQETPNGK